MGTRLKSILAWLWNYLTKLYAKCRRLWYWLRAEVPNRYFLPSVLFAAFIIWQCNVIFELVTKGANIKAFLTAALLLLWLSWVRVEKENRWAKIIGGIFLLPIAISSWLGIISWFYPSPGIGEKPADIETELKLLGGIAGLGALYFWWRRIKAMDKTNEIQAEGQVTERYTRAIDQLGKLDSEGKQVMEIRLGGIYALEQVAKEYPDKYHDQIMEVLTAYVRQNAPTGKVTYPVVIKPREDIQAVLTVIGRRSRTLGKGEDKPLDLSDTDLQSFSLRDAKLQGIDLYNTNLKSAYLSRADLWKANLFNANLQEANLNSANLNEAFMLVADLQGADLKWANFQGVNLFGADLRGAKGLAIEQLCKVKTLYKANLEGLRCKIGGQISIEAIIFGREIITWDIWVGGEEIDCRKEIEEKYPELLEKPKYLTD